MNCGTEIDVICAKSCPVPLHEPQHVSFGYVGAGTSGITGAGRCLALRNNKRSDGSPPPICIKFQWRGLLPRHTSKPEKRWKIGKQDGRGTFLPATMQPICKSGIGQLYQSMTPQRELVFWNQQFDGFGFNLVFRTVAEDDA